MVLSPPAGFCVGEPNDYAGAMPGLYQFEAADGVEFVPMAARRALDHAGAKLSLEGWRSLPVPTRLAVVEEGRRSSPSPQRVWALIASALPPADKVDPIGDPSVNAGPPDAVRVLGIDPGGWSRMGFLDRYVLAKLSSRDRAGRLPAAIDEIRASLGR